MSPSGEASRTPEAPAQAGEPGPEQADVVQAFDEGRYEDLRAQCQARAGSAGPAEARFCAAAVPASLYAQKKAERALEAVIDACQPLPPATESDQTRAMQLAVTMVILKPLMVSGKVKVTQRERNVMTLGWLHGCGVSLKQLEVALKQLKQLAREEARR